MSSTGSVNIQVAPMGHVERVVQIEQNHPVMQQQAAQEAARELLRREHDQVSKNDPKTGAKGVERDRERDGGTPDFSGNAKKDRPEEQAEEESSSPSSGNVWSGNILNIKV